MTMNDDLIVRTVARRMVPFLLLFGAYILLHGHIGAGGGFQAGIIITSAIILAAIGGDLREIRSALSCRTLFAIGAVGSVGITLVGILGIIAGGWFFQYGSLPLPYTQEIIHLIAITCVEIGIGVAVFGMMFLIFIAIAGGEE
jgi:multicomponent Na+:H+ antiporter subunit B